MQHDHLVVWPQEVACLPRAPSRWSGVVALVDGIIPKLWREGPAKCLVIARRPTDVAALDEAKATLWSIEAFRRAELRRRVSEDVERILDIVYPLPKFLII